MAEAVTGREPPSPAPASPSGSRARAADVRPVRPDRLRQRPPRDLRLRGRRSGSRRVQRRPRRRGAPGRERHDRRRGTRRGPGRRAAESAAGADLVSAPGDRVRSGERRQHRQLQAQPGRTAGVSTIAVASGPDGEFVFTVSHTLGIHARGVGPGAVRASTSRSPPSPTMRSRGRRAGPRRHRLTRRTHHKESNRGPSRHRRRASAQRVRSGLRRAGHGRVRGHRRRRPVPARGAPRQPARRRAGDPRRRARRRRDARPSSTLLHDGGRADPGPHGRLAGSLRAPGGGRRRRVGQRVLHPALLGRFDPLASRGHVHPARDRRRRQRAGPPGRPRSGTMPGAVGRPSSPSSTRRAASARRPSPPTWPSPSRPARASPSCSSTPTPSPATSRPRSAIEAVRTVVDSWRDEAEGGPAETLASSPRRTRPGCASSP